MSMRNPFAAWSLLLAGACAGTAGTSPSTATAATPAPAPATDDAGKVVGYVEHRVDDCAACANKTRCMDDSHWHYRLDDRVFGTHDQLRAGLRELARRFPEPYDDKGVLSAVALVMRPNGDASYASVQSLIQLAADAGIYKVEFVITRLPGATLKRRSLRTEPHDFRVALFWDEANLRSRIQVGHDVMRDTAALLAAVEAAFAVDEPPTFVIDADARVPWSDVALVASMAPGATLELASEKRFP